MSPTWLLLPCMLPGFALLGCAAPQVSQPEATDEPTGAASAMAETPSSDEQRVLERLRWSMTRLEPLQIPLEKPRPGDWLAVFHESRQSFDQYVASMSASALGERQVIYIQPLGEYTPDERRVLELTVGFLARFFTLAVIVREDLVLSVVPPEAQRFHPQWRDHQILTGWVLDELLRPALPEDAAALICLTTSDLWPGEGWNFVFGQANLRQRVAVWSLYRMGDPSASEAEFQLCLRRTAKTAAHELCHVFSIRHEIRHACLMNGSNHREEADRRPLWLCASSMAKLCWALGVDPVERYRGLEVFCRANGLGDEAEHHARAIELLSS